MFFARVEKVILFSCVLCVKSINVKVGAYYYYLFALVLNFIANCTYTVK